MSPPPGREICDHAERLYTRSAKPCFQQHARRQTVHSRAVRKMLLLAYNGRCAYGTKFCDACVGNLTEATVVIDHAVPFSKGGYDGVSNWVPCCAPCNRKKAAVTLARLHKTDSGRWQLDGKDGACSTAARNASDDEFVKVTPRGSVWHARDGCKRASAVLVRGADDARIRSGKLRPCKVCVQCSGGVTQ